MRIAEIINGFVTNVIESEILFDGYIQSDTANIGDQYINGEFVTPNIPIVSLADTKTQKAAEINSVCQAMLFAMQQSYPESEILLWPKQEAEALAVMADSSASAPLIDSIAQARGVTRINLAMRIMTLSNAYATAAGAIIGRKQSLLDQLEIASTIEAVEIIQW
jgi:hypothetical protein